MGLRNVALFYLSCYRHSLGKLNVKLTIFSSKHYEMFANSGD